MSRGKHARPSQAKRNAQRAGAGGFATLALMIPTGDLPQAFAGQEVDTHQAAPVNIPAPVAEAPTEEIPVQEPPTVELDVVPGDTLSAIAREKLGLPAWEGLYEENRAVVGDNPNLIFPGQRLTYRGLVLATPPVQIEEQASTQEEVVEVIPQAEVEQAEAEVPPFGTAPIQNSFGPVSPRAQEAADAVFTQVRGASLITIGGTRSSARDPHGHPSGNALDYMVLGDSALGDAIVQYHVDNWDALGVEYLIWQQRILYGPGDAWVGMENRGSATQNHMDHPHVNYL